MALTHVMYPSEKTGRWTHITLSEARKKFGIHGISSNEEYLMCSLCHDYVSYTKKGDVDSYFRHKREERPCPERSEHGVSQANHINYFKEEYKNLPLKIEVKQRTYTVRFGLMPLDAALLNELRDDFLGIYDKKGRVLGKIALEDVSSNKVTYFPLPIEETSQYQFRLVNNPKETRIYQVWPKKFFGFKFGGIFDAKTGQHIKRDSKVQVNREYVIIHKKKAEITNFDGFKVIRKLKTRRKLDVTIVKATTLNPSTAVFFYHYWANLTHDAKKEDRVIPMWPEYHQNFDKYYFYRNNVLLANLSEKHVVSQYGRPLDSYHQFLRTKLPLKEGGQSSNKLLLIGSKDFVTDFANLRRKREYPVLRNRFEFHFETENGPMNYRNQKQYLAPKKLEITNPLEETVTIKVYAHKILLATHTLDHHNRYTKTLTQLEDKELRLYRGNQLIYRLDFNKEAAPKNATSQTDEKLDEIVADLAQFQEGGRVKLDDVKKVLGEYLQKGGLDHGRD